MPSTSFINYSRRLFRNQDISNPPPSYQRATTIPSYADSTNNNIRRQQPDIFSQQYRICEQLVYKFIETGKCPECLRLGSPSIMIKKRICKHVIDATCYTKTMNILQILCRKSSIYYGDKNHHIAFDKADMPLSRKLELIKHLPELQGYQKCFYSPKQDCWVVHLK